MKKSILVILLFLSVIGISQTKTDSVVNEVAALAKSAIPDSASLSMKQVYNDIKSGITTLAAGLKVGTEQVFGILVKQQLVYSIINIVSYIVGIILVILTFRGSRKMYHSHLRECGWKEDGSGVKRSNTSLDDTPKGISSVFLGVSCGIIVLVTMIMFTSTISETVTGFINPEYGAIKEIMDTVKGGTKR